MSGLDGVSLGLAHVFRDNERLRGTIISATSGIFKEAEEIVLGVVPGMVYLLEACTNRRINDSPFRPLACFVVASARGFYSNLENAAEYLISGDPELEGRGIARVVLAALQVYGVASGLVCGASLKSAGGTGAGFGLFQQVLNGRGLALDMATVTSDAVPIGANIPIVAGVAIAATTSSGTLSMAGGKPTKGTSRVSVDEEPPTDVLKRYERLVREFERILALEERISPRKIFEALDNEMTFGNGEDFVAMFERRLNSLESNTRKLAGLKSSMREMFKEYGRLGRQRNIRPLLETDERLYGLRELERRYKAGEYKDYKGKFKGWLSDAVDEIYDKYQSNGGLISRIRQTLRSIGWEHYIEQSYRLEKDLFAREIF